ncbi:septum formation initiator family protein [Atopobacter sp. AH10]|uniref:FtsB family cell division protein n=1 Tax=Atopobacter sp. AH10 TaxID=2315861 RepID=UPI000EF28863|nr:septum formation initiator family protein [Atopobacter sp. AH10]RLK63619.1 septum formation initiator family protein [Atopobacter sp. AH10]
MRKTKKGASVRYEYAFSVKCSLVLCAIFALVVIYRTMKDVQDIQAAKVETEQVRLAVAKKKAENKDLHEQIERLQSEDYILELARSKYHYSFDDEIIFQLPTEQTGSN